MIPRRILVIHLKRIGDILLATPALRHLKKLFPQAEIDFLAYRSFADLLEGNPNLREIILYPKNAPWRLPGLLRPRRYDWVIDLLANGASAWASFFSGAPYRIAFDNSYPRLVHNVRIPPLSRPIYSSLQKIRLINEAARSIGVETAQEQAHDLRLELAINPAKKNYWQEVLRRSGWKKPATQLVLMSPQSRRATRRWKSEGYAWVAGQLAKKGLSVVCLWGPGERAQADEVVRLAGHPGVHVAPQFRSVKDMGAFVAHGDILITNCNGPKHVAVALNVPTLTIHMSSDPRIWNPPNPQAKGWHPRHPIIRLENLFCIGCQKNDCPYRLECSNDLKKEAVLEAALDLLAKPVHQS